jgi:ERCC4-type nuclease
MYIFDSREKKNDHIKAYFDRHEIAYRIEKLDAGDYMVEGGAVTVDRKQSIEEISHNLTNAADKVRFWNEVRLAKKLGLRLVVLIETNRYRSVDELRSWKSKYTPVRGTVLIREMERLRYAYGVEFRFCPKMSAAKKIVDILTENK